MNLSKSSTNGESAPVTFLSDSSEDKKKIEKLKCKTTADLLKFVQKMVEKQPVKAQADFVKKIAEYIGESIEEPKARTIGQVIKEYSKKSDCGFFSYRQFVQDVITSGAPIVVENDSYADALLLTSEMMNRAEKSFVVFIGAGVEDFIQVLRKNFTDMLERLQRRSGFAHIIVLDAGETCYLEEMKNKFSDVFNYVTAALKPEFKSQTTHFTVADSTMCRIEEPHEPITPESSANVIKAKVYFNNPDMATSYTKKFNTYWDFLTNSGSAS